MPSTDNRLFLIDSFGFIFRAYHARARSGGAPMRTAAGISTEAVYIFHNMVKKLVAQFRPSHLVAVFESEGPTFRDEAFEAYKANRSETPPDLLEQIPMIRKTLEAMRIPIIESTGFEADDVIGTLARRAVDQGMEVAIVSSDKDMLQLVNHQVKMLNPMKNDQWYDADETEKFMGVRPEQVADLLALKGDTVDNIPGAPGIGEKGAQELIKRFGSVENAMARAAEVERKSYRESLQNNAEQILLSKKLATIHQDVPISFNLEDFATQTPDKTALRELYRAMEFSSLLRDLGAEDVVPASRDYQSADSIEDLESFIAGQALVAVALAEQMGNTVVAVSAAAGVARSTIATRLPRNVSIAHDAKALMRRFGELPELKHDVMLYGFLLSADPTSVELAKLSERYLERGYDPDPSAQADAILSLYKKLRPEVEELKLNELYETIDLPMAGVLARMEALGMRIDPDQLRRMSARMEDEIARLSEQIYALAGKPFNINSPQQLGQVLFSDLRLPAGVKTGKGKVNSTAAEVLEDLADQHEIAAKVLEFRQIAKLKGTYADALPLLIDPATGRVHTTFNQAGAATGRLSSSNPNLQNIPIRTELGREIRATFVPRPGWKILVADYSQIELRLLAHMSGDKVLVQAFRNGEDIHTRTAAEVFGVPPLMVTPEHRRGAKAVNFGIVYGQTPYGLAKSLGIDRREADKYIKAYFERYNGVRRFIDHTIAEVRRSGVSVNLYGRRRPIPDMNSRNPSARGFAERTAVNTPLQGTAADMIKVAMIRIEEKLKGREARMLLQVHDELVFEAPPSEVDELRVMVKAEMEGVRRLEVPLVVDVGVGDNWRDAK
ncbi:MAG: DNA polymerase I [Acidobacteriota bacterium]